MAIDNPAEAIKFATSSAHGFPSQEFIGGYEYVAEYNSYTLYVRHRVTDTTFLDVATKEQIYTRFCNLVNDAKKWHKQWKKAQTHAAMYHMGAAELKKLMEKQGIENPNQYVSQYRRQLNFYDIGDGHLIPTGYDPEEI